MTDMPDSVALEMPEEWEDVPLDKDEYQKAMKVQLKRIEASGLFERTDLRQIELLAALAHQAVQVSRVMIASSFVAIEEAQDDDGDDVLLMANLIVSGFRRDEVGTDIPLSAELMVEAFSQGVPSDDRAARYAHIEPPSVCEIAGLRAVKLLRLMSIETDPGQEFKQFTQTYLVAVAEGDAVVVLQFSTANFEFSREFSELFERIAQTLRIFYPDDPTFLDDSR